MGDNRPYLAESNNLAGAILNDIRKLTTQSEEQQTTEGPKSSTLQTQPTKCRVAFDEKSLGVRFIENQSQTGSQKINLNYNIGSNKSMTD